MKHIAIETEKDYTVDAKEFARELAPLIEDFFTAEAKAEEGELRVSFTNGQTLVLNVRMA